MSIVEIVDVCLYNKENIHQYPTDVITTLPKNIQSHNKLVPWRQCIDFQIRQGWPFSASFYQQNRPKTAVFNKYFSAYSPSDRTEVVPIDNECWEKQREYFTTFIDECRWLNNFDDIDSMITCLYEASITLKNRNWGSLQTESEIRYLMQTILRENRDIVDHLNKTKFISSTKNLANCSKNKVYFSADQEYRKGEIFAHEWFPGHIFQYCCFGINLEFLNPLLVEGSSTFFQLKLIQSPRIVMYLKLLFTEAILSLEYLKELSSEDKYLCFLNKRYKDKALIYKKIHDLYLNPLFSLSYSLGTAILVNKDYSLEEYIYETINNEWVKS